MVLNDALKSMDPCELIYLGCFNQNSKMIKTNGSGFVYIGPVANAPVDIFGDREIVSSYPHETDYEGMTFIVKGEERGQYWFWHECDKSIPRHPSVYTEDIRAYEGLLVAMCHECIKEYQKLVRYYMKHIKPKTKEELLDILDYCRRNSDLEFVKGSGTVDRILQQVDDEFVIMFENPKIATMPYEKRYAKLAKERKKMMIERVRKQEKHMYAKIKGRSVKHE